jgi:hypothetical protein|tara:strand:- start:1073 stop:1354 length:282 start_codon:yes stop_codon:yes gene_type:complete
MKKEKKMEIMASTYDIASLIASVHSQADLTTQTHELIIDTVASWQAWMAEKLDLSSKDAVEAYKQCRTYDENTYEMSVEAAEKRFDAKNVGEA